MEADEMKLPKNIRQIGLCEERVKVYMEDFAYTYIQKQKKDLPGCHIGILLGEQRIQCGRDERFITAAMEVPEVLKKNQICFTAEIWKNVETEVREFFPDQHICGWFVSGEETLPVDKEEVKQIHGTIFPKKEKLLFWNAGNEEQVFSGSGKNLSLLKGYYVYYEKNEPMQNYMIHRSQGKTQETGLDRAARNFRIIMKEKQQNMELEHRQLFLRIGTGAAALVLLAGAAWLTGSLVQTGRNHKEEARQAAASVYRQSEDENTVHFADEYEKKKTEATTIETGIQSLEDGEAEKNNSTENGSSSETMETGNPATKLEKSEALTLESRTTTVGSTETAENQMGASVVHLTETVAAASSAFEAVSPEASEAAAAGVRPKSYIIQPGDTLLALSLKYYGTSDMVVEICNQNGISNPNTIYIGEEIELP